MLKNQTSIGLEKFVISLKRMTLHTFWKVICIGNTQVDEIMSTRINWLSQHDFNGFKKKLTCHSWANDVQEHRHEVIKGCYGLAQKTIKPPWVPTQFLWYKINEFHHFFYYQLRVLKEYENE